MQASGASQLLCSRGVLRAPRIGRLSSQKSCDVAKFSYFVQARQISAERNTHGLFGLGKLTHPSGQATRLGGRTGESKSADGGPVLPSDGIRALSTEPVLSEDHATDPTRQLPGESRLERFKTAIFAGCNTVPRNSPNMVQRPQPHWSRNDRRSISARLGGRLVLDEIDERPLRGG
jgi:hypothetical protein